MESWRLPPRFHTENGSIGLDSSSQFGEHLWADEHLELFGQRLDDLLLAYVGPFAFGAAPGHRRAVLAPVVTSPPAHGRHLGVAVARRPVDVDRQLPTDRRLPVER